MNTAAQPLVNTHPAFDLIRRAPIAALSAELLEFRHRATGAVHYHLAADNDENVFLVAFRTQPMDSRGVAHILEHTALCGSARFPVRDPFFSMIRRSLNTFMNAFTAADWTAYPFATQNRTDYFNLLSVYLDAAFFPRLHPLDFAQEGIRVELENDQPVFKGIVFNEMKGAMSSPTDQLYHTLAHHLYPETTYHFNSGGDPACIPDLVHQDLVDFHASHYHPSNAVLMTYGNLSAAELQAQFEAQALSKFQMGERRHSVPERRLTAPIQVLDHYAVDDPDLKAKTHIVLAWLLTPITDVSTRMALRLLEGVLLEDSSSPLRQYVETCGLGQSPSPLLGIDDSNYEMTFLCGLQGSEPEQADAFEAGVLAVLAQAASQPFDPAQVEAVLHQIELNQREITGDGMPYGLQLILNGLGAAIHDGDPLAVWEIEPLLAGLREQLKDPMWLPSLIQTHLLDNPHRVRLTLQPDPEKTQREAAAEHARLAAIAAQLDAKTRAELTQQAADLLARQAQEDDLSILPKVGLVDVPAELKVV
ncbi:MAG: insulinase family protein, partial [Pseudomonadota bacterium]|nr:insulinase family protein [Pseudomonadota bacterium]